jgi:hypothetical protein
MQIYIGIDRSEDKNDVVFIEHKYAQKLRIPIYYFPDLTPLHPTETHSPQQCKAFH